MNKRNENYLKVLLGLLSMAFMVYIGSTLFKRVKLDFTSERLYTLSSGTKSILSRLDSPIKLKLFYSKTAANKGTEGLRIFNNHFLYLQDLLKQFVSESRNNLSFEVIDPRPDTPEEEEAIMYGLKKFQLTDTEKYFFGLVAENESGVEKVIEFFDPNQKDKLEYDLIKLVYTVLNPQKKTIGILSSLDVVNEELNPYMAQIMRMQGKDVKDSWIVVKMLQEFYNVKEIKKDSDKISGIDTLVIIHPKGFSEKTLFAIDQYLLSGGKLLIFTDPHALSDTSNQGMYGQLSSSPDGPFKKLMDKWGIQSSTNVFAGDKTLSGMGKIGPEFPSMRLLPLLQCTEQCSEGYSDTISSGIRNAVLLFPGVLKTSSQDGVEYVPFWSTTHKGNSYSAHPSELGNPQGLWAKFIEGNEKVHLGVKALGKFKTAFPEGLKDNKTENLIKESQKETAIIVISDVDLLSDQFAFKQSFLGPSLANDNSSLFLNAVDALNGDVQLMSVRSKGKINRGFTMIDKIELESEKKSAAQIEEINQNIQRFQMELNQLGQKANEGNIALLQNEGVKKKKELAKKIALLKKNLRDVKREGREKVEFIGKIFLYLNTLLLPFLIILFGIYYSQKRKNGHKFSVSSVEKSKKLKEVNA